MQTTEKAPPGLVRPEYGPTAPELLRRHLGPRARLLVVAAMAVVVLALAALIATRAGDGLTTLEHRAAPVFTLLYPAGQVHRVAPGPGELVRLRARHGQLRMIVTVRRLTLPAYRGSVSGLLPVYIVRHERALAAELPGFRPRTDGKARVNDAPGYQLLYRAGPPAARTIGIDVLVVPADGERNGVVLRYRQTNPPHPLTDAERALVKATRSAFRSFRFGLDRP